MIYLAIEIDCNDPFCGNCKHRKEASCSLLEGKLEYDIGSANEVETEEPDYYWLRCIKCRNLEIRGSFYTESHFAGQ